MSCAWFENEEECPNEAEIKGLCRKHYDVLGDRLKQRGVLRTSTDTRLYWCQCIIPIPKQVTIFELVTLTDVFECERCGLAILD